MPLVLVHFETLIALHFSRGIPIYTAGMSARMIYARI
jgi:hypothetical protein